MIEPRRHSAVSLVLREFAASLDASEWTFVLIGSRANAAWLANRARREITRHRVEVRALPKDTLTRDEYSKLLMIPQFWESLPREAEHVLIFQTDSVPLRESKHSIDEFLHWPYIGAPWPDGTVGNGGLSLRHRSVCIAATERYRHASPPSVSRLAEDVLFHEYVRDSATLSLPPTHVAAAFSTEAYRGAQCDATHGTPAPSWGVHKPWAHEQSRRVYSRLCGQCPIIRDLKQLQH